MEGDSAATLVAQLETTLSEARASLRASRRWQTGMSFALVAVICSFLAAMYVRAEEMYAPEQFSRSLASEAQVLRPDVENVIRNVVAQAGPRYAELGKQRMESAMPRLQEHMSAELTSLTADLAERASARIGEAFAGAHARQLAHLRARFPHLQDDAAFQELADRWAREIQADTGTLVVEFHDRALVDFANLEHTVSSFRPNKYEDFEEEELVRYYAHLWLQLLDAEVLASVDAEGDRDDG